MSSALLVGDGSARYALPALRSLGRAGWTVGVGQPAPGPATASRWCARAHVLRRVEDDPGRWVEDVARILRDGRYDLVLPTDDIELLTLSAARHELTAVVPYPPHDVVLASVDKLGLVHAAHAAGLGAPETCPATPAAVSAVCGPVVVKARLHWTPGEAVSERHLPVQFVDTADAAACAVEQVRAAGGEPVLQEIVGGGLLALTLVVDARGRPAAVAQQETQRLTLRRTSARARTVPVDEALLAASTRMLQALGWQGLANLQFLRPADGVPRLIDLNARFYGSLALAVAAGADLPRIWADIALGRDPGPVQRARPGVLFQALDEDLLVARGGGAREVVATLAYAARATHSTWDRDDRAPARRAVAAGAGRIAGRAVAAVGAGRVAARAAR